MSGFRDRVLLAPRPLFQSSPNLKPTLPKKEDGSVSVSLTMGIELEFILVVYPSSRTPGGYLNIASPGEELVREALKEPMTAVCATCGKLHDFKLPVNRKGYDGYENWSVDNDPSLALTREEEELFTDLSFDFYAIEVKSRILHRDKNLQTTRKTLNVDHRHEISWDVEIAAVLARLTQHFASASLTPNMPRMILNNSCGLHVHVGNGERGYPLRTVKNVIATYIANERVIDAVHDASRISGSTLPLEPLVHTKGISDLYCAVNPQAYNKPWSSHIAVSGYRLRRHKAGLDLEPTALHNLFANSTPYPESCMDDPEIHSAAMANNILASLTIINRAPHLKALQELQAINAHNSTVNLDNLQDYETKPSFSSKTMTIEFRQHAATAHGAEVVAWVDLVVSAVKHAHDTDKTKFKQICHEWMSPNHHTIDLLKTIGCAADTVTFYREKLGMRMPGLSFADEQFHQEIRSINQKDVVAPLVRQLALERHQRNLPENVRALISIKFQSGGYGQFEDNFLDALDWEGTRAELREKLTIGWYAETPDQPEPEILYNWNSPDDVGH